ncbi:MAG: TauD/TfdA family dioxygenase [Alphaproteobacteria bacterium]|nr:TauD/TfdA family dioxygenase [Alphaproteobacteria bacterium]
MPGGPISGPSAWYGKDIESSTAWIYHLSDSDLVELHGALQAVQSRGLDIAAIRRTDFPLPTLGATLDKLRGDVLRGRGFVLIRGLPVERYSMEEAAILYWGIGCYFGSAVPQNAKGHLLGHVIDLGRDPQDTSARIYQTTARQTYHVDTCDIVSLLCLQKAKSGGLSSLVSAVTIYNEMSKRRPDLAAVLFESFEADRRDEIPPGRNPYYSAPIFSWHDGLLTTQMVRRYIESARRFPDLNPLTDIQIEALDLFEKLADELCMFMEFAPGDMQFVHNHQILHDRTEFEDYPDKKRHLLRLWLCPPDGRPLPPSYEDKYNGDIEIGKRGGMYIDGATLHAPLEPV